MLKILFQCYNATKQMLHLNSHMNSPFYSHMNIYNKCIWSAITHKLLLFFILVTELNIFLCIMSCVVCLVLAMAYITIFSYFVLKIEKK